jgi:hypothetical protein
MTLGNFSLVRSLLFGAIPLFLGCFPVCSTMAMIANLAFASAVGRRRVVRTQLSGATSTEPST